MKKQYDCAVYIGRFNMFHDIHLRILKNGLELADKVIIFIGSHLESRTPTKNPFTALERQTMISNNLSKEEMDRIVFIHQRDWKYMDSIWAASVNSTVDNIISSMDIKNPKICLIGSRKDNTTYYIDMFPQWKHEIIPVVKDNQKKPKPISATNIRNSFFEEKELEFVPEGTIKFLKDFKNDKKEIFDSLQREYDYIKNYKKMFSVTPHPVLFQTVDCVVIKSNHVLLVERKKEPGKGLNALPGGFLNPNETLLAGALRELKEETKILIPNSELVPSKQRPFDAPDRSERGRTLTTAFLIDLGNGPLPKVKGGDDAKRAFWMPFHEISMNLGNFFEDHAHIIEYFMYKNDGAI